MELILPTALISCFVGFVFGWLAGHARHNSVLRDMEAALLQIEKENSDLLKENNLFRRKLSIKNRPQLIKQFKDPETYNDEY